MAQSALPSARTSAREIRLGRFHMAEMMRRTVGKEWDAPALMRFKASGAPMSTQKMRPRILQDPSRFAGPRMASSSPMWEPLPFGPLVRSVRGLWSALGRHGRPAI